MHGFGQWFELSSTGPNKKAVERFIATAFINKKTAAFGRPAVFEVLCKGIQGTAGRPAK